MADVGSRYAEAPEEIGLEGKNDRESVYVSSQPGGPLRTPSPELRSDVIQDRDPSCPGGPCNAQMKTRIVHQNGEVIVTGDQVVT